MRESKVAVYHLAGWFDRYLRDQVILFKNLGNPQKLAIGPWSHVQNQGLDFAAEHLRWWDYWLKGIDNGVMAGPAVHYYAMGSPEGQGWRAAKSWPLPEERRTEYFFAAGPSGSVKSANDGGLGTEAPKGPAGKDDYTVDYSAGVWPAPRWSLEADYAELTANDSKGLTYTTTPLTSTVEVTGHPVVHLWVSSSAPDADLFVYLEEVDAAGVSRYVSEGALRASHRALSRPAHDTFGLPYHRSHAADRQEMPKGVVVELVFDLFPTSNLFDAGNRIRVTVTGADRPNHLTPELTPAPRLTIHRSPGKASRIVLPVIPRSGPS
jgi:putative CocE/NonD family hydrolase